MLERTSSVATRVTKGSGEGQKALSMGTMRNKGARVAVSFLSIILLFVLSSGCAVLNPFRSEFHCPPFQPGECIPMREAYEKSLISANDVPQEKKAFQPEVTTVGEKSEIRNMIIKPRQMSQRDMFYEELHKRTIELLREQPTPLVIPPRVIRILFVSYEGEQGHLFKSRHVYVFVDRPRWVLDAKGWEE